MDKLDATGLDLPDATGHWKQPRNPGDKEYPAFEVWITALIGPGGTTQLWAQQIILPGCRISARDAKVENLPRGGWLPAVGQGEVERLLADNHRLRLGDMSAFDYERIIEWINDPNRKDPSGAFTAGAARTAAIAIQDSKILIDLATAREKLAEAERQRAIAIDQHNLMTAALADVSAELAAARRKNEWLPCTVCGGINAHNDGCMVGKFR